MKKQKNKAYLKSSTRFLELLKLLISEQLHSQDLNKTPNREIFHLFPYSFSYTNLEVHRITVRRETRINRSLEIKPPPYR